MAEADSAQFSLLTLEEELTCSICLSTFVNPVTTPCGHNFCQECLLETWKDSYCCPQCRTDFATKPELKKNTVLCTVVDTFNQRANKEEDKVEKMEVEKMEVEKMEGILCDTCMQEEAVKTCLTCMASFCEQHLRPHQVNPIYSVHQLKEPIADLKERICSQHHKLMELFCSQHLQPICSLCLQSQHRGCSFTSPEEQRSLKESEFREKLCLLDQKIEKTNSVITQIKDVQSKLKDSAKFRKTMLSTVYQQIRDLLAKDEQQAQDEVSNELEDCLRKHQDQIKSLLTNNNAMTKAKENIISLLIQSQTMGFLKASFELPKVVKSEPHVPRVTLDSKKVLAIQTFADSLKESLTETFKQPVEARTASLEPSNKSSEKKGKPKNKPQVVPVPVLPEQWQASLDDGILVRDPNQGGAPIMWIPSAFTSYPPQQSESPSNASSSSCRGRGQRPRERKITHHRLTKQIMTPPKSGMNYRAASMSDLLETRDDIYAGRSPAAGSRDDSATGETRRELLKYGTSLTLDPRTAHARIMLSEDFTKASVSEENTNYFDCPQRFAVSTQVMAIQGFCKGCYYWEVNMSIGIGSGIGIGVAYGSITRKGPASRLGRNSQSWCVECICGTISTWHNNRETKLIARNVPQCIGVLLEYNVGRLTFYNVDDKTYPLHTFVCSFTEPVWPVFWLFSRPSSISLCNLRA
uniref:E3 ubiquitin/ISG15 ligase TRIM25-like n=1 Tax=Gouania willdenowi TaxID=441366 RepID=A0A8C5GLL3_GOUWI